MHEHTSECRNCVGIGEVMDSHGVHECRSCRGTGLILDRLDHRQVEAELREIRAHGNTLSVLVFIALMATLANWILIMIHLWAGK